MRATPTGLRAEFHFDFIDPCSYVASAMIDRAGAEASVRWFGLELRPPPAPFVDAGSSMWRARCRAAAQWLRQLDLAMSEPAFLPWTRKAHELCELARERDRFHPVRRALFRAHFVDRLDIGRIDLLCEVAERAGLDLTEARVALDVDRHAETLTATRRAALERKVACVPTLIVAGRRLEDCEALREIERAFAG